jgi:DNA-binding YbaB/EbfC family protein
MSLNLSDMMAKVQEMQSRMAETQQKLKGLTTTADVGGGMVAVTMNGKFEVTAVKIDRTVVSPDDVEMLEDLVVSAFNKALAQAQAMAQQELGKATSGMLPNIPGLDLSNFGL